MRVNIVAADWLPYALPLKAPWQTSGGTLTRRDGCLLRLQDVEGRVGWGDRAAWPEFGIDEAAATGFAEETAYLDLLAQASGLPLNAWLSGRAPAASVAVNANFGPIFAVDRSQLAEAADQGFQVIKLKAGLRPVAEEIAALHRIATNLPPTVRLRLDANRAWSAEDAANFVAACADLPIEGLEEPLADPRPAWLDRLQSAAAFPIAIDESIHLLTADFFRTPAVRRIVLKPARHGGLLASIEIALRARASGIEVIVTSSLESVCGLLASAHLAAAVAPEATHGLATADWFARDTGIVPEIIGGRLLLPSIPGLGFRPSAQ